MDLQDCPQYVHNLALPVELELASIPLALCEALRLEEGTVLKTNQPPGALVNLSAGGVWFGVAEPMIMDGKLCVRMLRIGEASPSTTA